MRQWSKDVCLTRRGLIAGAAGLLVAHAARADLLRTPRQTAGPFYPRTKPLDSDADLTLLKGAAGPAKGETIEVVGRVLSLKGHPLDGITVEIWQADSFGRYNHPFDRGGQRDPNFQGFGAVRTGSDGAYRFRTIRPRHYGAGAGVRTPHIHYRVHGGGRELVTQMYFPGEAMNARDFLYLDLPSDVARDAVTARHEQGTVPRYLFDLVIA